MRSRLFLAFAVLSLTGCATTTVLPPPAASPVGLESGMISAADPRAAAAGVEMLRQGGTAADAALATMVALTVVEPQSSGIGGGSFMVTDDGRGHVQSYDSREAAPHAASGDWFFVNEQPLTVPQAIPGGRSVGVPGNMRQMALVHRDHGRLAWAALFQPAIRLARDGFHITPRLFQSLGTYRETGALSAEARALYYQPDGSPKPVGTLIRNPALAAFLKSVAARGPEAFYHGDNAGRIVAAVTTAPRNPAPMAAGDLATYDAKERIPVCGTYRTYRICGMGPPSSGATTVFATLKMLERFDLSRLGPDNVTSWHLIAESMRLAYADRDKYLADSDYVHVPVAGLIDAGYLSQRAQLIAPDRTMTSVAAGNPHGAPVAADRPLQPVEHGTSHFVAVDRAGNIATITSTIESPFGSGLMVNGYYLNNELTDFSLVPQMNGTPVANRVEGGKRPRSSMAPTIVYAADGRPRLAVGAAGGATIPAQVLKAIIGVIDWRLSAQQAIALPVLFSPGDTVFVERGSSMEAMVPQLEALGHKVQVRDPSFKANAIEWVNGRLVGAADPRSEGVAISE
ncbi:gamma-glutamyltransferase [Sphingomonas ginkgonis]|uniref:Glutathione hydrolase proenzyme n=1 Tax=Sphingomonas ginkgonis TaxID=2315330 RepID=A0A3R9Y3Y8_9SPHN|nr:gamma-glutamyltransferase [Sphingomonas ginkgonis]RST29655.1 gamma-glutamyltransferase [Sphingomonas ginkgonis]